MPASIDQRIGDLAIEQGLITKEQLSEALAEQGRMNEAGTHTRLGQILVRREMLSIDQLMKLLKSQTRADAQPVQGIDHKYRILQELGAGSAGMVYLAEDVQLGRPVALKVLRPDTTMSKTSVKRFLGEGKALAKLRHPGIVQVFEIGQIEQTYFIAMEYVPGETLERHLTRAHPGFKDAAAIVANVADAVEHAHAQGIVHRDLKPQNIMVETQGSDRRIRVMDFGLAHDVFARTRLTATGAVIGTPMYMAPEQVSAGPIDVRTDVYAIGAILYESITGRPPFVGRTTYELYEAIAQQDPLGPRRLNPRIPPELELIALTALNKIAAYRYASAGAMAEDLRRFLKGEPVTAKGLSMSRRLLTKARRHRVPIAVAVLLVAVAGVVAALFINDARTEREFVRLVAQAEEAAETGDLVEASQRLGQAAVLRRDDARLATPRRKVVSMIDRIVQSAEAKLREGKAREAADLIARVLAANAVEPRAVAVRDQAEALLRTQGQLIRDVTARLQLAQERIGDVEKAITLPPSLYDEDSLQRKLKQARDALAENLKLGGKVDPPLRAQTEYLLGRVELLDGRFEEAIKAFARSIEIEPSGAAYYARGEAHLAEYRSERLSYGARDEDLPEVYRNRLREMREAAALAFKEARNLQYGTGEEAVYLEALVDRAEERYSEALEKLKPFQKSDQVRIWLLRGEILQAQGMYAEASAAFEAAVDIARSDPQARLALATARLLNAIYGRQTRADDIVPELDKAIAAIDAAIDLRSARSELYLKRGKLRLWRIERFQFTQRFDVEKDLRIAREDFEKAAKLDPKDHRAHSGLAIVMMHASTTRMFDEGGYKEAVKLIAEYEAACKVLDEAIRLNPFESSYYKDRGLCLSMIGLCQMLSGGDPQPSLDAAFEYMQRSLKMDDKDTRTHESIALVHLWQATVNMTRMQSPKPELEKAIASASLAVGEASVFELGRTKSFRSVLRMTLAFYLSFLKTPKARLEAADLYDAGAQDMKEAAKADPMMAVYDHEPIAEFGRGLRALAEGKDGRANFESAEAKLARMAEGQGGGQTTFLTTLFARAMRGFCFFYTDRFQPAVDEWNALVQKFPPIALLLGGWIAEAKRKLKPKE